MISGIVNKIKTNAEKLYNSISQRPWKSLWSVPKAVYGATKYLVYHPTRLTIKGLPYAVNLEQTWKKILTKIGFGNPDVYFDVKENKTTSKGYGTGFDPIMKKKGYDKDVRVKVPRYKLPQRSMQQFEAWLESSEEDKENKNFIPKSSDNKKLSDDEQNAYNGLIELHEFLEKDNGSVRVEGGTLVIRINTAGKTLKEIEDQVKHCYDVLDIPYDKKMVQTITKRLYKKVQDQAISSDEPFAKTKQMPLESVSTSPSHSVLPPQDKGQDTGGEIIEGVDEQQSPTNTMHQPIPENPDFTLQSQDKQENINRKTGETTEEQTPNIEHDNIQFSLTNPGEFPNNVVSLQSGKKSNELQSDLVSRCQFSGVGRSDMSDIKNQIIDVGEDLGDVSLSTTNIKSSYISGSRRGEELSKGRSQG